MELQLNTFPFPTEMQIIAAFVLMILGTEIVVVLLAHLKKNPESGVALIRACIVGIGTVVVMKCVEFTFIVQHGTDPAFREEAYGISLVILDLGCVALFVALRQFTRPRKVVFQLVMPGLIGMSSIATVLHLVEILSTPMVTILPDVVSAGLVSPIVVAPGVLVIYLHSQSDRAIKPYYKCIIMALAMLGIGAMLHLLPVEDLLVEAGANITTDAAVSVALSIAGIALFFVTLFMMPYIEDLFWRKEIVALYLLNTGTGRLIFKRGFLEEGHQASSRSIEIEGDSILAGGLIGIEDFVREMTNTSSGNLEFIDKGGMKFMLSRYKQLLFIIIARVNLPVIRVKLSEFKSIVIKQFIDVVKGKAVGESQRANLIQVADSVFKGRASA